MREGKDSFLAVAELICFQLTCVELKEGRVTEAMPHIHVSGNAEVVLW